MIRKLLIAFCLLFLSSFSYVEAGYWVDTQVLCIKYRDWIDDGSAPFYL